MREDVLDVLKRHLPGPFKASGGSNVQTKCPFHKEGEERKPSFSINLDLGVWQCFTEGIGGGMKKLLELLRVPSPQIDSELRIIKPLLDRNREMFKLKKLNSFVNKDPFSASHELPEPILGIYDYTPPGLVERGFDQTLLHQLDVGFDQMHERVTWPIRDAYGTLAGISGGTINGAIPKYKVYEGGRKNLENKWVPGDFGHWFDQEYPGYTCEKSDFLWNFHRFWRRLAAVSDRNVRLYLTEGFKTCTWLLQHGYEYSAALMGTSISDRQQQLLHRLGVVVVLCLDNDEPGRKAMLRVGDKLWNPMWGRILVAGYPEVDESSQLDDYGGGTVHYLVQNPISFETFVNRQVQRGEV